MAGYSSIFCLGGVGGFQGCDGINPINLQIFVGNSDRMWLESQYVLAHIYRRNSYVTR
jgi:hypothetical protein